MDWREQLRSFPVIAAGVIVIAIIIGVIFGLMGPKARPLPQSGAAAEESEQHRAGVKVGKADHSRPSNAGANTAGSNGGGKQNQPRETGTGGTQPKDPRKPVETSVSGAWTRPKELKPGRKDTMAARIDLPVPQSSLLVSVFNQADHAVDQCTLNLDILADGIGWQRVNAKAQSTGKGGEWRFSGLYAGTYLVYATLPGYPESSAQVLVPGGMQEIAVRLEMAQPQYGRVDFSFAYEDGGRPEMVYCLRTTKSGRDGALAGRFEKREGAPNTQGGGSPGIANYAIPQDTGVLVFSVLIGTKELFTFSAQRDSRRYAAKVEAVARLGEPQVFNVTLTLLDPGAPDPTGGYFAREAVKAEFNFKRSDDAPVTLRRCNLRTSPEAATYTAASTLEGGKATFLALQPGNYFLVAEADGLHAAFVKSVTVTAATVLEMLIEVAPLTISVTRDAGANPPQGIKWTYRAALRPLTSGAIETFYNREIASGKSSDSMTYNVPAGSYTLVMGSTDTLLACEPPSAPITLTREGANLSFTLRTAATLEFMCIDTYTNPVPGVEFLVSYSPAGQIPESERTRVELGGPDGRCILKGATYGRVYLHVWVTSSDFQAPDRTYEIDLPSYGVMNLGAVTVK